MKRRVCNLLALSLVFSTASSWAQIKVEAPPDPPQSALDAQTFYQVLLGELNAQSSDPGTGFAFILDAARRTNDAKLYQRAVSIAFAGRSGDGALQAARAWQQAQPQSREANRNALQILIALNRPAEANSSLRAEIDLAPVAERNAILSQVPRIYARATEKALVAKEVEQALGDYLTQQDTAAAAWTAVGRLRMAAGQQAGALAAAVKAQGFEVTAIGPALLALDLLVAKYSAAESVVNTYLQGKPAVEFRMAMARYLLNEQRYTESAQQLIAITQVKPEFAEAWLVLGTLQVQDRQYDAAEKSLKQFIDLAPSLTPQDARQRSLAQAYLSMAQIAEKRKDFAGAEAWLARITDGQALMSAQTRRASLMARQGKVAEARALIKAIPERAPEDARNKLLAEVQLLRDLKLNQPAFELLSQTLIAAPTDIDLLYDHAMLAEKAGRLDVMEQSLRQLIAAKPDYHHAYNALGYSFADRNVRLPEAKALIQKALSLVPNDPYIQDSLGWVEFRLGDYSQAMVILDAAYKARPDPEIAAHLGEVLWTLGLHDRAHAIWNEGLLISPDNETLLGTLKRIGIKR
jgi:tetratricopeptide (TPR) repeat protein